MRLLLPALLSVSLFGYLISVPGADAESPPLDQEYPRLLEQSVQVIRESLKEKPNRRAADKARVAAMLIAATAQSNLTGADGARRAAVRDAALAVADLIKDDKFDQARRRLDELSKPKPDVSAKKDKLKLLGPRLDVEDLMTQFRPAKVGGLGLEAKLDRLSSQVGGVVGPADLNDSLLLDAYRTAVTAELTAEHTPKTKAADWKNWSLAMRKEAVALGEAVKARDGKAAFQAVTRLNRSCNQCHRTFRNN